MIDATIESFVFELTGTADKIDQFVELMRPIGLVEVSRTGVAAISRGPERSDLDVEDRTRLRGQLLRSASEKRAQPAFLTWRDKRLEGSITLRDGPHRPAIGKEPMRVYYDRDADINLIKGKKVAIVGYGSQGHAHALNMRDSGVKDVVVALRKGSPTAKKAEGEGLKVMEVADAAKWADVVMMLTPDELQADIYATDLAANMKQGAALLFAHGLNVHFNLISRREDLDVLMVAPKGPGHTVRGEYLQGRRRAVPGRDPPGRVRQRA